MDRCLPACVSSLRGLLDICKSFFFILAQGRIGRSMSPSQAWALERSQGRHTSKPGLALPHDCGSATGVAAAAEAVPSAEGGRNATNRTKASAARAGRGPPTSSPTLPLYFLSLSPSLVAIATAASTQLPSRGSGWDRPVAERHASHGVHTYRSFPFPCYVDLRGAARNGKKRSFAEGTPKL